MACPNSGEVGNNEVVDIKIDVPAAPCVTPRLRHPALTKRRGQ
jgi:hypothetical protein